jgi:hypothetical protein
MLVGECHRHDIARLANPGDLRGRAAPLPNEKVNGDIVELRGRIKAQDGQTAVGAKGRVLVTDRL